MRKNNDIERNNNISTAVYALVSATLAIAFVFMLGASSRKVGPLEIRTAIHFTSHGRTELSINPFGRISAHTHSLPVAIVLSVQDISVSDAKAFVKKGWDLRKIARKMKHDAMWLISKFLFKLFLLGIIGGAFGAILGRSITLKRLMAGAAVGAATPLLLLTILAIQYNTTAFNNLEYSGAINESSDILPQIQDTLEQGLAFRDRLDLVTEKLASFYLKNDKHAKSRETSEYIRVLHISDMHNNPIAAEMVYKIYKTLAPDIVLNSGDITDLGMPLELNMMNSLKRLKEPMIFVSGNHDFPKAVEELKKNFGAVVLDGNMIEVKGLRILGFGSPSPFAGKSVKLSMHAKESRAFRERIQGVIRSASKKPDILIVHYPHIGRSLAGSVPVILAGHTHNAYAQTLKNSLVVNAGTTGAAGARYFLKVEKPKYTVALITFKKSGGHATPLYADIISLNERTGNFTLKRTSLKTPVKSVKR
ncbi:MAG: metallophosphoesterase [bacterium]